MKKKEAGPLTYLMIMLVVFAGLGLLVQKWWDSDVGRSSPQRTVLRPQPKQVAQNRSGLPAQTTSQASSDRSTGRIPSDLFAYFPINVGRTWTYDIDVPRSDSGDPLVYRVVSWKTFQGESIKYSRRQQLVHKDGRHELVLRVAAHTAQQGFITAADVGCRLTVVKDTLGMFDWFDGMSFAVFNNPQRRVVVRVLTVESDGLYADKTSPGYGFVEEPIFLGDMFLSYELVGTAEQLIGNRMTTHNGRPAIVFKRTVDSAQGGGRGFFNRGFIEETTYVRGVGLALFVQKVDGNETIRWTLRE